MKNIVVLFSVTALTFSSCGFAQSASHPDLGAIEAELTKLRRTYSDQHPEVVRLLRRIDEQKSANGSAPPRESKSQLLSRLQSARVRLAELRRQHGNDHPEVEKQIEIIKDIEQQERK